MNFDGLSDYLDDVGAYVGTGEYDSRVAQVAPAPRAAARSFSLGEFDARQLCLVRPLSKLAWAYLATVTAGDTMDSIGILSVYRSLFTSQRAAILSGLSDAAQRNLPTTLPETAFTSDMKLSMQIILSATTGGVAARNQALASMPDSVGALGTWFSGARGLFDEASMRTYLDVPRIGGETVAHAVLSAVQDDIAACLNPGATAPVPGAPAPAAPVIFTPVFNTQCPPGQVGGGTTGVKCHAPCAAGTFWDGSRCSARAASGSGGLLRPTPAGGGILIFLALAIAGAGYWVYRQETTQKPRTLRGPHDEDDDYDGVNDDDDFNIGERDDRDDWERETYAESLHINDQTRIDQARERARRKH